MKNTLNLFHLSFVLVLVAAAGYFSSGNITGLPFYRDYGYTPGYGGGFLGFFGFSEIYAQYASIIDAAIFLLIFLGIGKGLLKKHLGEGSTSAYTGIGLFLAFALLLWEERTGISLLEQLGPLAAVLFVVVVFLIAFKWMHNTGLGLIPALCLAYMVFYFFVYSWRNTILGQKLYTFFYSFPLLQYWADTFLIIALVGLVISIVLWYQHRGKQKNQ